MTMVALSKSDLPVQILEFEPQYAQDFAQLNYEWLEHYFDVEPHDREMLDYPMEYIIQPGGYIFFAKVKDDIVGTVALIKESNDTFELAKMGVTTDYRGLKIGQKLIHHTIAFSKKEGFKKLFLESNTKLTPALHLYEKSGFKEVPTSDCSPYARCNIRMEMKLKT